MTGEFSRRSFLKYTALTAVAVAGSSLLRQYLAVQRQFPELFRCGEPAPAGQRLHRADAHGA